MMLRNSLICLSVLSVIACSAVGQTLEQGNKIVSVDESSPRVIAIGDVHGDYTQFVKLLGAVGLLDKRNRWIGGNTHLVQLGDIPDRGPDSRKTMDLLMKLERSAVKAGGAVTVLIGNHEAMNMTDDLRYVHPGEYRAFKNKKSKTRQNAYYRQTIEYLTDNTPAEELPTFDKAYKIDWEKRFPLGYVEHRLAWSPTGKYGKWVLSHAAVAKVGDSLFVHGGISQDYSTMSISEINTRARTELADPRSVTEASIVEHELGPLWYRGWARLLQNSGNEAVLDNILAAFDVRRMVIAHTPTLPIVLPRFGGKVLMVDVGLSAHYGNGFSALEIVNGKATAMIGQQSLALPTNAQDINTYLDEAATLIGDSSRIDLYKSSEKARIEAEMQAEQEVKEGQSAKLK